MKKMIESITGGYVSSAKVVDGTLILTLPDALSPVVWRMDLTSVRSSALEVRDQKDGTYTLALKTPRNDVHDIAPFAERGQAIRALMAVSHALENGGSGGNAVRATTLLNSDIPAPAINNSGIGKWITGVAAVLVLFVMISVLAHQSPQSASFGGAPAGVASNTAAPSSPLTATMGQNTANAAGVPVSADDFLRQNSKQ